MSRIKPNGPYYLVGEMTPKMAIAGHLPAGPIFITPALYDHIKKQHPELAQRGLTPSALVHDIVDNYTEVRRGSGDSYTLVRYKFGLAEILAVGFIIRRDPHLGFYIGKIAWITKKERAQKKTLIAKKKKPTSKGR